ncbi:hypothetical protein G6L37_34825 [Agrobacterium rubi]|nr:hypothetical protein [Agrobacterium rubi]NTF23743.1 hypothetical protein [Agrobacterium rubi]
MPVEITGPLKASSLLTLHEVNVPGLPPFANLKARRLPEARKLESLKGPGIYGLFCKDRLYYVGIYTGASKRTFAGNVLDRWDMHLTYHSLRSPKIRFVPSNMLRILQEIEGEAADVFAEMLGGRDVTLDALRGGDIPFVGNGPSCTFNKALFAARNWDVFAPGDNDRILSNVSFVYGRVDDPSKALLEGVDEATAYQWAKYKWLKPRETALINDLRPICNSETGDFREDVTSAEFVDALAAQFATPLETYVTSPSLEAA